MCPTAADFARELRKRPTDAENLLWKHLRAKRLKGLKFRRQEPFGHFIVDFVCYEKRVIIEIDGGHHAGDQTKDRMRDECMSNEGFKILRFWNNDVLSRTAEILETILRECLKSPSPSSPPIEGGE